MDQYQPQFEEKTVFEDVPVFATYATTGQRLVNYLVDRVAVQLTALGIFVLAALMGFTLEGSGVSTTILDYLLTYITITCLYTLTEGFSKGYSLGKLITGTRAVIYEDYSPITFREALLRSLCRLIPFNVFSGLGGNPWHDQITKTCVIQVR